MKESNTELYREELEELTGKLYRGDITPLMYDLLKDSMNLGDLLFELTGEKPIEQMEETIERPQATMSFEDWFNSLGRR